VPRIACLFSVAVLTLAAAPADAGESPAAWYREGAEAIEARVARSLARDAKRRAKNVILFVGDGMGVSTVTAARIHAGQKLGLPGEEYRLSYETFEHVGLAKVYNTNQQTPDSAGTMTAMMSGVKTDAGLIGVNQRVVRGDCSTLAGNEVPSALEIAEAIGMATGIVTTARIAHATPAATYAKSVDRDHESDADVDTLSDPEGCTDIARQLVDFGARLRA